MKRVVAALALAAAGSLAAAQDALPPPQPEAEAAVRQLYVCHFFYEAGTRSTDKALSDKSARLSMQAAFKATTLAVDMGSVGMATRLSSQGQDDYRRWLGATSALGQEQRGDRLQEFQAHCVSLMDSAIAHDSVDRGPREASRLYFCAAADRLLAERAQGDERDRLTALAGELHAKADAIASRKGQQAIDPALERGGQAEADAWANHLDAATPDGRKAKLLQKFELGCTRAANHPGEPAPSS